MKQKKLWQLSDDAIAAAVNKALTNMFGTNASHVVKPAEYDIAVARAAEVHLIDWLQRHDIASRRIFNNNTEQETNVLLERGDLWIDRLDWQSVRAAAEKVK